MPDDTWKSIAPFFSPPPEYAGRLGSYRSPLTFDDGRPVARAQDWPRRRQEILKTWHGLMGPWPPLLARPAVTVLSRTQREDLKQERVRIDIAPGQTSEGWLLTPPGPGPFAAVLVVFYEPETSIGLGKSPL